MTAPMGADEGWYWPSNARKAHYYVAGRSLCGKWAVLSWPRSLGADSGPGPDDCAGCRRALDRRAAKETER